MKKNIKIGMLTLGDGRDFVGRELAEMNVAFQKKVGSKLEKEGYEVVAPQEPITSNELAVKYGKMIEREQVDCVIFNYCIWAWPAYSRLLAQYCPKPVILYANVNPGRPAMVGMLAAAGSLDQIGIPFYKIFGDIDDDGIFARIQSCVSGISAFHKLRGQTYVNVGGRSISIDTCVADPALWMDKFGMDVDQVDQFELVRRAELLIGGDDPRLQKAIDYLNKHVKRIEYTEDDADYKLTPLLLKRAVALYYAMDGLREEFKYDFAGIKGQRELAEHYCTSDLAEGFLCGKFGPAGEPHEPFVCSTECDMDGALTMQVMQMISGQPQLFADIRSYYPDGAFWDFCNSGAHATWFADPDAKTPEECLANVEFRAEGDYYVAGGPSVYHIAKPGKVTLARLTRSKSTTHYRMLVTRGEFVSFGEAEDERIGAIEQYNWPHAFCRLDCDMETFIQAANANHIHGTYGDWVRELEVFCECADIEFVKIP
jgi:L-fucose isomerase